LERRVFRNPGVRDIVFRLCAGGRDHLADGEKAYFIAIRKDAYERLHPETALGGGGRGQKKVRQFGEPSEEDIPERFTAATAKVAGVGERTNAAAP
jgi:hypothetical protein